MSKQGRKITAAELMNQLNSDPEYLAQKDAKDAEIEVLGEACKKDESELVSELNSLGLKVNSVWDLVNNSPHEVLERKYLGSYEVAYPLLVEHLDRPHHPRIREGIIRALTEKSAKDIASAPLLRELANESNQSHRWVVANALRTMLSKSELIEHPQIEEAYGDGYL